MRVFPGKTFAFVNFLAGADAIAAKAALDGHTEPAVTGAKPLAIRCVRSMAQTRGKRVRLAAALILKHSPSQIGKGLPIRRAYAL